MAFVEDLTEFFRTADHAVTGVFTPSGGSATTVIGIFDNVFADELNVGASMPVFICDAADVSTMSVDDTLTITGSKSDGDYLVRVIEPDGTGVTELQLQAVIA